MNLEHLSLILIGVTVVHVILAFFIIRSEYTDRLFLSLSFIMFVSAAAPLMLVRAQNISAYEPAVGIYTFVVFVIGVTAFINGESCVFSL